MPTTYVDFIHRFLKDAPPLTDAQRAKIARLLAAPKSGGAS